MFKRIIFCVMVSVWPAAAQQVVGESAQPPAAPPKPVTSSPSVISQSEESANLLNEIPLLQWGPVSLRPHLLYRFIYGDGIQSSPGQSEKTIIQEISPGILFNLGKRWTLDYTPTLSYYSSTKFRDTLAHSVNLNGNFSYENWVFGLLQSYNKSSQPLVETGTQTDEESYVTALFATYHFSDEVWLDLGLNQNLRYTGSFADSRDWSTLDWLNYQIFPGLNAAIGGGFGYVDQETGSDMTYEQLLGRIRLHTTEKIFLNVNGGAEFRQFLQPDENVVNPIYGLSVEYRPFEQTTLSVSGNRRVSVSYFANQITEATDVRVNLDQRLLEKLKLNLGYGYTWTRYVSSLGTANRRDRGSSFTARLSCPIKKRITLATFYNWSENNSDQSAFEYSSTQVGLEARYEY